MRVWPEGPNFRMVYDAVYELMKKAGGDPDMGGRVPDILSAAGLEIVGLLPVLRVGQPGSPLWRWLEATAKNHTNLVESGLITAQTLAAYHDEWDERAAAPGAYFTAPPLLATVARKS